MTPYYIVNMRNNELNPKPVYRTNNNPKDHKARSYYEQKQIKSSIAALDISRHSKKIKTCNNLEPKG